MVNIKHTNPDYAVALVERQKKQTLRESVVAYLRATAQYPDAQLSRLILVDASTEAGIEVFTATFNTVNGRTYKVVIPADNLRKWYREQLQSKRDARRALVEQVRPQRSWESARAAAELAATDSRRKVIARSDRLICACSVALTTKDSLCLHVVNAYCTRQDIELLIGHLGESTRIKIPIGMGKLWVTAKVTNWSDPVTGEPTEEFVAFSDLEYTCIQQIAGSSTKPSPTYLFNATEGMLGYVKYLEDLVRSHPVYDKLSELDPKSKTTGGLIGICTRTHSMHSEAAVYAGLSTSNVNRNNFLVGCAASVIEKKICLPCQTLSTSTDDVPDF